MFIVGLLWRRVTHSAAVAALLLGVPVYGALLWQFPEVAFLNHMAITFVALVLVMTVMTLMRPLPEPFVFETSTEIALEPSVWARRIGWAVIVATVLLYIRFW